MADGKGSAKGQTAKEKWWSSLWGHQRASCWQGCQWWGGQQGSLYRRGWWATCDRKTNGKGRREKLKKKSAGYQGLVQKPEIMRKVQEQICVVEMKIYYDCYVSLDTGQWLLELYVYCRTLGEQGDAYEAVWFVHASGRMKSSKIKAKWGDSSMPMAEDPYTWGS